MNYLKIGSLEIGTLDKDNEVCVELDNDYAGNIRIWISIEETKQLVEFLTAQIKEYERK